MIEVLNLSDQNPTLIHATYGHILLAAWPKSEAGDTARHATRNNVIIGAGINGFAAGILFGSIPDINNSQTERIATVSLVATTDKYRRSGVATAMFVAFLDAVKSASVGALTMQATSPEAHAALTTLGANKVDVEDYRIETDDALLFLGSRSSH